MPEFQNGDRIHVKADFPGVRGTVLGTTYVVARVNPKNVIANPADGSGPGINYPKAALELGDAPTGVVGVPYVPVEFYGLGEVVTLKTPYRGEAADQPYVVVKDDGRERVNVARLGNTDGQYLRAGRRGLVRRDLAWLAAHLATCA